MTSDAGQESERGALDRVARALATVLDVSLVSITVIDRGTQVVAGSHGVVTGDPNPLCSEVASGNRPILVQDAQNRHAGASRVPRDVVAYAGVPLPIRYGHRIGTLAVFSGNRRGWQDRDLSVLRGFAEAAAAILDTHARCNELLHGIDPLAVDEVTQETRVLHDHSDR